MMNVSRQRRQRGSVWRAAMLVPCLLLLVLTASERAQGQWATNGTDINNTNTGNVGIGTATPLSTLNLNQTPASNKGLFITGAEYFQPAAGANASTGIALLLGVNRPNNRQLWIGDTTALGSPTLGFFRIFSGSNLPGIDAVSGDGISRLNVTIGSRTKNVGIGLGDELAGQPASKLTVAGNFSVGDGYYTTTAPANGVIVQGNVGIGTTTPEFKLDVVGDIRVSGNIAAKYQDVAEWVPSTQRLLAGTVVVLDPDRTNHVLASGESYDTKVAGVISAQPGLILGEGGEGKVKVATTGRVKVKVDASTSPIKVGDLLVTSNESGVAMRSEPLLIQGRRMHAPGTLIGKALEPLASGKGEILVLLSLQ